MRAGLAGVVAAVLCAAGCAAGGPGMRGEADGATPFPAPEELHAIARRAAPARVFPEREPAGPSWDLKGAPETIPAQAEHAPEGFWDGLLAAEVARRAGAVHLTEPMACVARLAGRYMLDRDAPPGRSVMAFLAARCGAGDPNVGWAYVTRPLDGRESDVELQQELRAGIERQVREVLAQGASTAGIWFGREKLRSVVMVVHARPLARLESLSAVPGPDGHVAVRGVLLRPADRLEALINRGRFGYRACAVDPAVALPRFAVDCETDPADEEEVLEIAAYPPRRIMGPIVVQATVWPRRKLPGAWRPPALGRATVGGARGDVAAELVAALNGVRAAAGLAPVALAPSQSTTAALLAPHYFAANAAEDSEQVDAIAVGVMAGWQVDGLVRTGHFTSSWAADAPREGALLARVLERPTGREALLDPDIRAVAVGAVSEGDATGAVFGTYAFLAASPPGAEAAAVARRIDQERARRGLPPALVNEVLAREVADIAASVERGERTERAGMKAVLDRASRAATSGKVGVWSAWVDRLERLELPEQVLGAGAVQVVVGVGHCKPKGSPWFGYCVLIGAVQPGVTAALEAGTPIGFEWPPLAMGRAGREGAP